MSARTLRAFMRLYALQWRLACLGADYPLFPSLEKAMNFRDAALRLEGRQM